MKSVLEAASVQTEDIFMYSYRCLLAESGKNFQSVRNSTGCGWLQAKVRSSLWSLQFTTPKRTCLRLPTANPTVNWDDLIWLAAPEFSTQQQRKSIWQARSEILFLPIQEQSFVGSRRGGKGLCELIS